MDQLPPIPTEKYLSDYEIRELNNGSYERKLYLLKSDGLKLQIKLREKEIECLKLKVELDSKMLLEVKDTENERFEKYQSFRKELKERLDIETDRFGYDPESGLIIEG